MSRLPIALLTGLLFTGHTITVASELKPLDPVRATLLNLARNTPTPGLPADSRLALARTWVDGAQAQVCAVARRADGELLVQDGRLQVKRVQLRKHGSRWAVEHTERIVVEPNMSMATVCNQRAPETQMAEAIRELEQHPPAAGIKAPSESATASCRAESGTSPRPISSQVTSPAVVAKTGRSKLHTVPDPNCLMGKHIVEGDKVVVLAQVPDWTQVRYTHPITGVVTVGWLKSERIKLSDHGPNREQSQAQTALSR